MNNYSDNKARQTNKTVKPKRFGYGFMATLTILSGILLVLSLFASLQDNLIYGTLSRMILWIANGIALLGIVLLILIFILKRLLRRNSVKSDEALAQLKREVNGMVRIGYNLRLREQEMTERAEGRAIAVAGKGGKGSKGGKESAGLSEPRFAKLCDTDRKMSILQRTLPDDFDDKLTLDEICTAFRSFAASRLGLYYDISVIREFISGIAVSKLVIIQGMSGTGKTSLAYAFGEFLGNKTVIVPVQPSWKERTDLLGYFNEFTKKYNETELLQKLYEASYSDEIYITVLDEMNIARVEYYFAEFLSLLEFPNSDEWYTDIVSDSWSTDPVRLKNGRLKLPTNMWYVGTANNDDSTFAISDKVYDRAMILNLDRKAKPFEAPDSGGIRLSKPHFDSLVVSAKTEYAMTGRVRRKLEQLNVYLIENLRISFGNRIMKQIESYIPLYLACGGAELDALDDILAKKVLRKLESQNLIYVRSGVEGLNTCLDELFGTGKMQSCRRYLRRFEQ